MALTPDDIEKRQFGTSRKGYSPDEVKRFLAEVADAQRQTEATPAFARLGDEVASVLESVHRSAESITTSAQTDAEQTRAEADAYAIETRAKAERDAADHFAAAADDRAAAKRARDAAEAFAASETERITQAKKESEEQASSVLADAQARAEQVTSAAETQAAALLDDAETRSEAQLGQAEDEARRRSTTVIAQAQGRLDKLLSAERDVHDRLVAASADIRVAIGRVAGRQAAELELATEDPTIDIDRVAPWNDAAGAAVIDLDPNDPNGPNDADEPWRGPASMAGSAQGDALSRMVNDAVGNALKGLQP